MAHIFLFVALCCAYFVSAFDLIGRVTWNTICPGLKALGQSSVTLDDGVLGGSIIRNGSFAIPDVPEGTYVLSVISHDFVFDRLRIDVSNTSQAPVVRPLVPGTPLDSLANVQLPYPISLVPRQRHVYFLPPQSFSVMGMLSNPMMLLTVFGGSMMFIMPYLIKNMDPELLQDVRDQQAKMSNMQDAVSNGDLKRGFSSLLADSPAPSTETSAPLAAGKRGKTKSGKKGRRGQ